MKNLVGQKFGKLIVLEKAKSILSGKNLRCAWKCQCDCGNIKIIKANNLLNNRTKSCGCIRNESRTNLKNGDKINRLTLIEFIINKAQWKCSCDCGTIIYVKTGNIINNNTKSCGCLKTENLIKRAYKLADGRRKSTPQIASAKRVWKNYCYRDKECTITFDEFLKISQQNCTYCGSIPNTKYNYFSTISSRSSEKAKQEGLFIYNGLDRIDSSKSHTIDNVVPCCILCNRSKNNRTLNDFLLWVNNLKLFNYEEVNILKLPLPDNKSLATSIRCVFYNHKKDTDLTVEEYYSISQMNCFYCNNAPNNNFNRAKTDKKSSQKAKDNGEYIYNGIDRIDSNFEHYKNNIVPCCKYCNFAKSNLSLDEFYSWISRIKQFQNKEAEHCCSA